jgi:hypothetical protein
MAKAHVRGMTWLVPLSADDLRLTDYVKRAGWISK